MQACWINYESTCEVVADIEKYGSRKGHNIKIEVGLFNNRGQQSITTAKNVLKSWDPTTTRIDYSNDIYTAEYEFVNKPPIEFEFASSIITGDLLEICKKSKKIIIASNYADTTFTIVPDVSLTSEFEAFRSDIENGIPCIKAQETLSKSIQATEQDFLTYYNAYYTVKNSVFCDDGRFAGYLQASLEKLLDMFGLSKKGFTMYPTKVVFNDDTTIVFWPDNTKTMAKCTGGDDCNYMIGFLYCVAKKMFNDGNNSGGASRIHEVQKTIDILEGNGERPDINKTILFNKNGKVKDYTGKDKK